MSSHFTPVTLFILFVSISLAADVEDPLISDDTYIQMAFSDDVDDALMMIVDSHMNMERTGEITRIGILIGHYEDQLEKLKSADLKGADRQAVQDRLIEQMSDKVDDLRKKQDALKKSTRRSRPRGIFGAIIRGGGWLVGRTARLTGKVVGGVGKGTGMLLRFAIEEELPARLRDMVMGRLRELGDVFKGRIEMIWKRIADRYGGGFTRWLRGKVDPAFIRMRNSIARKLGLPVSSPEEPQPVDGDLVIDLGEDYFEGGLYWGTFGNETAGEVGACECIALSADISSMSLHLEFDFEGGTVGGWIRDGTLSYSGEDGLEFAEGSFDVTLGGTVTPTQDGSWEFQGTAKLDFVVEGRRICGRIIWEDDVEYVYAEGGAEVPGVTAAFTGGSEPQMAVGGGQFFLTWRNDEVDCQGSPSMEFKIFNPYNKPFPYDFPPVPGG